MNYSFGLNNILRYSWDGGGDKCSAIQHASIELLPFSPLHIQAEIPPDVVPLLGYQLGDMV